MWELRELDAPPPWSGGGLRERAGTEPWAAPGTYHVVPGSATPGQALLLRLLDRERRQGDLDRDTGWPLDGTHPKRRTQGTGSARTWAPAGERQSVPRPRTEREPRALEIH